MASRRSKGTRSNPMSRQHPNQHPVRHGRRKVPQHHQASPPAMPIRQGIMLIMRKHSQIMPVPVQAVQQTWPMVLFRPRGRLRLRQREPRLRSVSGIV